MTRDRERLEAAVRGRVQGVGFRFFVSRQASELRLEGWVANRSDGAVHVVAEGDPDALDRLESALWRGPSGAVVDAVTSTRGAATGGFSRFEIRSGSHPGD
jgi:acylphosphatase